jgi:hypothetical protein
MKLTLPIKIIKPQNQNLIKHQKFLINNKMKLKNLVESTFRTPQEQQTNI